MKSLNVIIVNWNTRNQLRDCVASIRCARTDGFILHNVVIIDNGSTDDSLCGVENLGVQVTVIRNVENRGFAAACNQGAAKTSGDYLLFLNPDTRMFENSMVVPFDYMEREENANVGICGIQLVDETGLPCLSYAPFPSARNIILKSIGLSKSFLGHGVQDQSVSSLSYGVLGVDQVIGAFFIVRRVVFDQLAGFDENFFVYYEEVDFSLRALNSGWASVCLTDAQCIHIGGGASRQVKAARLFYSLRSRVLYGFKHFSLLSAITTMVVTVVVEFFCRSLFASMRCSWSDVGHTFRGYAMLIKEMPVILKQAIRIRNRNGDGWSN